MLNPALYIGLVFMTMGTLFKIQHWPYGAVLQAAGSVIELAFFVMVIVEIARSRKATTGLKAGLIILYSGLPAVCYLCCPAVVLIFAIFIVGTLYLSVLRKKILYTRGEVILHNMGR